MLSNDTGIIRKKKFKFYRHLKKALKVNQKYWRLLKAGASHLKIVKTKQTRHKNRKKIIDIK